MLELNYILKIVLAIIIGFILGLEREINNKEAGIKTNILICLASSLFSIISIKYGVDESINRITAQVISGVGFLGAGTILKYGSDIKGLTTASLIWISCALGICVGYGEYILAISCTIIIQIILFIVKKIEKNWLK